METVCCPCSAEQTQPDTCPAYTVSCAERIACRGLQQEHLCSTLQQDSCSIGIRHVGGFPESHGAYAQRHHSPERDAERGNAQYGARAGRVLHLLRAQTAAAEPLPAQEEDCGVDEMELH